MSKKRQVVSSEVDFKLKHGNAWSHNYLNQKPWHPMSYPNQRRKWIAEQLHAQDSKVQDEVNREFQQEQDFLRTSALLAKKDRDKLEAMQAVSFMYTRPPGYNAESARAAELADEQREAAAKQLAIAESEVIQGDLVVLPPDDKKKHPPTDVFGRKIATAEDFPQLQNAPKLDTGVAGRARPFGLEIRNVKCLRCGAMGHQSGDRDCPLKDELSNAELERQKREDPLNIIMASISEEPLKWELKQQSGVCSPPRGGFRADDPNQQIIADAEDEFDQYGGFLVGDTGNEAQVLLELLKKKEKRKNKKESHSKRRKEKHRHRRANYKSESPVKEKRHRRREKEPTRK